MLDAHYYPHLSSASVDYETDRKIQDTIAYEFEDRTILCIARKPNEPFSFYLVFDHLFRCSVWFGYRSSTYYYFL